MKTENRMFHSKTAFFDLMEEKTGKLPLVVASANFFGHSSTGLLSTSTDLLPKATGLESKSTYFDPKSSSFVLTSTHVDRPSIWFKSKSTSFR
jgi:hypothetical protein